MQNQTKGAENALFTLDKLEISIRINDYLQEITDKIKEISKLKNVHIIGPVSSITDYLKTSTLLISPFKVPHFSRPVIEAFSYGKTVIVSDVKGMDEIVNHDVDGLIIEQGNAFALAKAINKLVNHPELAQKMGSIGRKKAIEFYAPKVNVDIIEKVYLELTTDKVN